MYVYFVFGKEAGVAKYACAALSSMAEAEGNNSSINNYSYNYRYDF